MYEHLYMTFVINWKAPPPQELFYRPFIGDASVVVPECYRGCSCGAKVLDKLTVPGHPTILITVGQGHTALAVSAGEGCLDIFTLIYPFFPLSPSLWETARCRLKYCLKGPLNPRQPTNQPSSVPPTKFVQC